MGDCKDCSGCKCGSKNQNLTDRATLAQIHNIYGVLGVLDVPTMKKEMEELKKEQEGLDE